MGTTPDSNGPVTPTASQVAAESRRAPAGAEDNCEEMAAKAAQADWDDSGFDFRFGRRLKSASATRPYVREHGDPLFRTLSIYTSDPATLQRAGAVAEVKLAYEPLAPGPVGSVVEVVTRDETGVAYNRADLDQADVLLSHGYRPSLSSPEFHAQMVYTVTMLTYHSFQLALGRPVAWPFRPDDDGRRRLTIKPFGAAEKKNAWYDSAKGELVFGYFQPTKSTPVAPAREGSRVYTSLSHDVVVHEMSHALLDGMRARFLQPTHPDVLALHEAFADLMAFFQQFQFDAPVRAALTRSKGELLTADDLVSIAHEFGTGLGLETGALRTLVETDEQGGKEKLMLSDEITNPHARGAVLARAVVSAFVKIYERRTKRYIGLVTGGRDSLQDGELTEPLLDLLVSEVKKLAVQIQSICIRAIDYCPPVDVRFGDYLRALITADMELVPDDDLGYRETLIRSFGERGIYGEGSAFMTEDALRWRAPKEDLKVPLDRTRAIAGLATGIGVECVEDMREQLAIAVGELATIPENGHAFGIVSPRDAEFDERNMGRPVIDSISIARRVGHDQQMTFDVVAEITQRRTIDHDGKTFDFYGGSTIIMDCKGAIRFAVRKRVNKDERMVEQARYIDGEGARFWELDGATAKLSGEVARELCAF